MTAINRLSGINRVRNVAQRLAPISTTKNGLASRARSPSYQICASVSEVERKAGGDGLERRPANCVVGGVAAADLIAVAARSQTIMRPLALGEFGRDNVPARPVVEAVARPNGILIGRLIK